MMIIRKVSRLLHRELSFFFAGVLIIYAVSGLVMNHRSTFNPNYSVEQIDFMANELPSKENIKKSDVLKLLASFDEQNNYTKHYYPNAQTMKVFIKGGSSIVVDLPSKKGVYEKLTRRPLLSAFAKLHYNPGSWWTMFSDIFAVCMIVITITGVVMIKGPKGLWGRGGIETLIGIAVPILFLLLQ
jgi:hypothetical protein